MRYSRKCSLCEVGWPDSDLYEQCPKCMEITAIVRAEPTLSEEDAASLRSEALFGWWLLTTGRL